ncbi:MAG: sigma 54-interacting transcriptional regulator [Planctomycetota bacterium]
MSGDLPPDLARDADALLDRARRSGALDALRAHFMAAAEAAAAVGPDGEPSGDEPEGRFGMLGASPAMQEVYALIERVAPSDVPVLIQGETGTGKELVARALHENSARRENRLLAENCAAVPENLLESELFGHKKGAFTGAVEDRPGHFVAADGGTVFLDEIGDMPLPMQAKLLRVLQDGEVRPVGSNATRRVDVRIIAATHRDLPTAVQSGAFREDLLFRLNVITIHLPPLREREGDVARIARGLLPGIAEEVGRSASLSQEALGALEAWRWPGNVRELENELRRAVALSDGTIGIDDLSPRVAGAL